ncbi:hypothetical protein [Larkinella sp. C7]|uniref:hypothetical protein n=1 Tax=Larkinella sp. C7 TaxID=2576607 RepID=UPI001111360B|nr:hypothetical protein [Larkinella sp. C7]
MRREADFKAKTINTLQKRAAFICSNPSCKVLTLAPSEVDSHKIISIGVAAHITAAEENGPRFNKDISLENRSSIKNAIFLCSNCASLIDKNGGIDYSTDLLKKWKIDHEKWVRANLNKNISNSTQAVSNINNISNKIITSEYYIENYSGNLPLTSVERKRQHDIGIFSQLNSDLSEEFLKDTLDTISAYDAIMRNRINEVSDFIRKATSKDFDYLNSNLQKYKKEFLTSLDSLKGFVNTHFFFYPEEIYEDGDFQLSLYPALNIDRKGSGDPKDSVKYADYQMKLNEEIRNAWNCYSKYRDAYKNFLREF